MDVMKLLKDYPFATLQDVEQQVITACPDLYEYLHNHLDVYHRYHLNSSIPYISKARETQKLKGREHVEAGPLLHVHSVHVQPKGDSLRNRPLSVFGKIRVKYENRLEPMHLDVYNHSDNDADIISPSGGDLALGWPDDLFRDCNDLWVELHGTTIEVDLYFKIGDEVFPLAQEEILVEDATEGYFEEVRSKEFHGTLCSATLIYIAMPFGALCKVDVRFYSKDKDRVVNVAGKIVARYKNTYGNYDSEACVLFDKQKQNGFEPVKMNNNMSMSRKWFGLPAYSSLEIDLDLRDFNTNRELVRKRVELLDWNGLYAGKYAVAVDGFVIIVDARLCPYRRPIKWRHWNESEEDESDNESSSSSSNYDNPRCHHRCEERRLFSSELTEVYSIFIGCKKTGPLKLVGTVDLSAEFHITTHYVFKRTGNDGVEVEDSLKVLPVMDENMSSVYMCAYEDSMLDLKVNLEDVGGKYQNKGFATYDYSRSHMLIHYDAQMCSVFPGKDGFCALHYSIFPKACHAKIEIFFKIKSDLFGVGKIYGSASARYGHFDYSTQFKRDYFQSVLFKRAEKESVQLGNDGTVPLSRSVVAVPMGSSLVIEVCFCSMFLKDHMSWTEKFQIGRCCFNTETSDYELGFKLTWSDGR